MNRRQLLVAGSAVGSVAVAGCNGLVGGGESEAALDAVQAASEDLLDANDALNEELESFGSVETPVEFDPSDVEESLASARENLDTAEAEARADETLEEIEALRSLADYVEAKTTVGERLATGHDAGIAGFDSYGAEEYEAAVDGFEDATSAVDDAESAISDARSAIETLDVDAMTHIDADKAEMRGAVTLLGEFATGYGFIYGGVAQFTRGVDSFGSAGAEQDEEEYGSAATTYGESRSYFEEVPAVIEGYQDASLPEQVAPLLEGLDVLAAGMADLAGALASLMEMLRTFEDALTYLDADRYDAAIEELETADEAVSTSREHLDAGRQELERLQEGDGEVFDVIEVESFRERLDGAGDTLEALDRSLSGLGDYARGVKAFEAGSEAGDRDAYAEAAIEMSEAAEHFGSAESQFKEAESYATGEFLESLVDLVCFSGALAEATQLFAEGYRALEAGDAETARQKFDAGQAALEQCDTSDSGTPALAGPGAITGA